MLTEQYDSTDDVDIDELVGSMRADLNRRATLDEYRKNGNKCPLICKIVHRILLTDRNAYEPSVLSIGPYHHSESPLLPKETEKWICVDYVLKLNRDVSLLEYLSLISGLEKQVRGCYSEDIDMDSKEFLQMLLLDSCFILVYLGGMHGLCRAKEKLEASVDGHETQEDGDTVEWYNSSAVYDLLLLENQILFFIVRTIYQLFSHDITAYVGFMSEILSTAADVALLAQKGIIVHQMESDEEVSTLFTKLFEHVSFDFNGQHYLRSLFYAMEAHYQSRVNRWMAWLWHRHFSNPWLGFAAITSAFIVLCSIMQTVLAFLSYIG